MSDPLESSMIVDTSMCKRSKKSSSTKKKQQEEPDESSVIVQIGTDTGKSLIYKHLKNSRYEGEKPAVLMEIDPGQFILSTIEAFATQFVAKPGQTAIGVHRMVIEKKNRGKFFTQSTEFKNIVSHDDDSKILFRQSEFPVISFYYNTEPISILKIVSSASSLADVTHRSYLGEEDKVNFAFMRESEMKCMKVYDVLGISKNKKAVTFVPLSNADEEKRYEDMCKVSDVTFTYDDRDSLSSAYFKQMDLVLENASKLFSKTSGRGPKTSSGKRTKSKRSTDE